MMPGCGVKDSSFNEPLPWIGLFGAMASLLLSITFFIDAFRGFRHRMYCFPCNFFSLNFTSLTLLPGALLLLGDLNTYMPSRQDQLVKLSSPVLTCIAVGNLIPSLGTLEDSQVGLNTAAVGIILISVLVNACIQMGTGVIYAFRFEQSLIVIFISVLLLIFVSTALIIPTTKQLLGQQYDAKTKNIVVLHKAEDLFSVEKLKDFVKRHWAMSHACNPQNFLACSATGSASGALCVLCAVVFIQALLRSIFLKSFCDGISVYKWSSTLVLISHTVAIAVGAVAPAFRWLHAVSLRRISGFRKRTELINELHVEGYWVQGLVDLKERPLYVPIRCSRSRKFALWLKKAILNFGLIVQNVLVLSSKFILLISVLIASQVKCFSCFSGHGRLHENSGFDQRNTTVPSGSSSLNPDISNVVLHTEGEREEIHFILRCRCTDAEEWIRRGIKRKSAYMMELLNKSTRSAGFERVGLFDCGDVRSLVRDDEPPNCWALPLVTLTSITMAVAYSCNHHNSINQLIHAVNDGLKFVRIIEKKLDTRQSMHGTEAADNVWLEVELYKRWLHVDLRKFARGENNPLNILKMLAGIAKDHVESGREQNKSIPAREQRRRAELLAANSMYRISLTIQQHYDNRGEPPTPSQMVEWLQTTIADILGACLTNLPRVVSMQCSHVAIHSREESAREAAYLLGEAEDALGFLGSLQSIADLDIESIAHIDNWRLNNVMKTEEMDACI